MTGPVFPPPSLGQVEPPRRDRAKVVTLVCVAIIVVIGWAVARNGDDESDPNDPGYICVNDDPMKACARPASNDVIAAWCLANGYPDVGIARIAEQCKVDYIESHRAN